MVAQGATAERASWNACKDEILVEAMLTQARAGKRADSGFNKEAWIAALATVNEEAQTNMAVQQIKSRLKAVT